MADQKPMGFVNLTASRDAILYRGFANLVGSEVPGGKIVQNKVFFSLTALWDHPGGVFSPHYGGRMEISGFFSPHISGVWGENRLFFSPHYSGVRGENKQDSPPIMGGECLPVDKF